MSKPKIQFGLTELLLFAIAAGFNSWLILPRFTAAPGEITALVAAFILFYTWLTWTIGQLICADMKLVQRWKRALVVVGALYVHAVVAGVWFGVIWVGSVLVVSRN